MYDLFEHRHRFSVWAAARAAQRGLGASVDTLREAVEACGIVEFIRAEVSSSIDDTRFAELHRIWCASIIRCLGERGVRHATYGRAAKLVAVYLKAMVVAGPHAGTDLARAAHPPIDRILLQNMAKSIEASAAHKRRWRRINWTELDEAGYHQLVGEIRKSLADGEPLWKLERYWTVTEE